MDAYISGFLLGLSLIIAIGAQNAFILRQGLRREHVFAVCAVCAGSDAILIAAGVAGFGALVIALPLLAPVMRFGGAAFLLFYSMRALMAALRSTDVLNPAGGVPKSLGRTLLNCLAFTWLNPHLYLDIVLLGSVSTRYVPHRVEFGLGAVTASLLFFFSLGYGARLLRPLFANPRSWRILDSIIGVTMLALAARLALSP
jgi:L-lysine exporter family protein LysE/ArgO